MRDNIGVCTMDDIRIEATVFWSVDTDGEPIRRGEPTDWCINDRCYVCANCCDDHLFDSWQEAVEHVEVRS